MKRYFQYFICAGLFLLFFTACDNTPDSVDYQKEIMVFGYLWANESLDESHAIQIAYSQPIDEVFHIHESMIPDAEVTLTDLNKQITMDLIQSSERPGYYYNKNITIEPETEYLLTILTDGQTVTAQTSVPAAMKIETALSKNEVNYVHKTNLGSSMPLYIDLDSNNSDCIVLVELYCNEPYNQAEYITPFHSSHKFPEEPEEYDGGIDGEPRRIQALVRYGDLLSENYENKHAVYWYESMIVFYGSYTMQVSAIDENLHYYLTKEHPVYNGGIQGGLGVFASLSGNLFSLKIEKEEK